MTLDKRSSQTIDKIREYTENKGYDFHTSEESRRLNFRIIPPDGDAVWGNVNTDYKFSVMGTSNKYAQYPTIIEKISQELIYNSNRRKRAVIGNKLKDTFAQALNYTGIKKKYSRDSWHGDNYSYAANVGYKNINIVVTISTNSEPKFNITVEDIEKLDTSKEYILLFQEKWMLAQL